MPLYEFYCNECGITFESYFDMSATKSAMHCNKVAQRVYSIPNIRVDFPVEGITSKTLRGPDKKLLHFGTKRELTEYWKRNNLRSADSD